MSEGGGDHPPLGEDPRYLLRWRGRTFGPCTLADIEALLARREISPLHEALCDGRWIQVRELLAKGDGFGFGTPPLPQPAARGRAGAEGPGDDPASGGEQFHLRWKGVVLGPFSMDEIERRLDTREIGMLHEIDVADRWLTLEEFFVQRNVADARERHAGPAGHRGPPTKVGARIVLYQLARTLRSGATILDDINLVIEPNEFVALLGPSGSGKSTLMNAMTGRQPASRGMVTLNGEDFYANSGKYSRKIGYVPQKDIVHLTLDVQQTLTYAAQLRLPASIGREPVAQRVADVVRQIGLQDRIHTRNSELSGGQLKRVSLGVELLSDPELLFLDEATSGLDAGTEARMMSLFRRLADDGRTVVCITHNLENVSLCDLVAVLVGGRLAYYGPTAELVSYLGVRKISQIYDRLETKSPDQWARLYETSAQYQKYVAERLQLAERGARHPASPLPAPEIAATATAGGWRQFLILTRRYFAVTVQDRRNVLLLLIQAPIIALLLGLVFHGKPFDESQVPDVRKTLGFLLVVSAIWFGCINAAREIVKELPIYLRERAVSLSLPAYLGSKIVVLTLLCVVQCATLLSITLGLTRFRPDLPMQSATLLLTSVAAMLMGLVISAVVKTEDKAMAIVPVLLIPQVIFSGAILDLSRTAELLARWTIVAFWSFDAMLHSLAHSEKLTPQPFGNYGEDMVTIAMFIVVLAYVAAFALKRKDPLK
jgi:ABC-type multidrug transport system ATPase subunit